MPTASLCPERGSSLLEAVIAAGLLATVLTGVLPLVTNAAMGAAATREDLIAAHLARQRLAQLQTLIHVRTVAGVVGDEQSALDQAEAFTSGGPGLVASGLAPLETSTPSWVDWLNERGAWQSDGVAPPFGARYRRRWGVLATGGEGCLRLWVEVVPLGRAARHRTVHAGSLQCPWGVGAS